jgi:hypothetical protein
MDPTNHPGPAGILRVDFPHEFSGILEKSAPATDFFQNPLPNFG